MINIKRKNKKNKKRRGERLSRYTSGRARGSGTTEALLFDDEAGTDEGTGKECQDEAFEIVHG